MKGATLLTIALLAVTCLQAAHAADIKAGKEKAQAVCAVCHGPLGVSTAPDAPHLAGQPAMYLSQQLRAFRAGVRKHEVMGLIAKTLSDREVEDLSAWYASIRIEARESR